MDVPAYYIRQKSSRVTNSMPSSTGFHLPPALCKIKSNLFLVHRLSILLSEACRNHNAGFGFCQEDFLSMVSQFSSTHSAPGPQGIAFMSFFRSSSGSDTSIFSFRKGKSGDVRSTWAKEEARRHRKTKEGPPSPPFPETPDRKEPASSLSPNAASMVSWNRSVRRLLHLLKIPIP